MKDFVEETELAAMAAVVKGAVLRGRKGTSIERSKKCR